MSIVMVVIAFGVFLFVIGMILTIVNVFKNSKNINNVNNMQNNFFQSNIVCPRCQKEIDSNLSYCPYCGYSFK